MDRIEEWKEFNEHMEKTYLGSTQSKYGVNSPDGLDLMTFTGISECLFSILKYVIRLRNGQGKPGDFEKIAHYAQIAWLKERGKE